MKTLIIIATSLCFSAPAFILSSHTFSEKKVDTINNPGIRLEITSKNQSIATPLKNDITKWNADASKSRITFTVNGPFGTVHGSLSGLKSTILFDENDLAASSIQASVVTKTISTGIGLRNRDLQKEKYLNSDTYPLISFNSDKIQKSGSGYKAIGDLKVKGVTKRIEIPFSFSKKDNSGVFKGNFEIQRNDYGIGKAGGSIGNTISISLEVPVTK